MSRCAILAAGAVAMALAGSADAAGCAAPPSSLLAIDPAPSHVAARAERGEPVTIVAIGSSSTQGVGASAPDRTYPSRLEIELRRRLPAIEIRVVNRGRGGEEVAQMLARLDRDVLTEHPDLVIWQLGTNAVLHHDSVAGESDLIARGITRLRNGGADLVLMDMQYAPQVIARPAYAAMERLLAGLAKRRHVGLFRRFAIMQYWRRAPAMAGQPMIGPDGLHMNDRGYGCLAAELAQALTVTIRSGATAAPPDRGVGGVDRDRPDAGHRSAATRASVAP